MSVKVQPRTKLTSPGKDVVRESLEGLVQSNPGLRLLEGVNCVLRHDFRQHIAAGKVCVVSGGGSGHEPAFCGLVGAGFLTGAVAGATFTSPPPNQILAALRKLASAIPISPWSLQQQLLEQPASNGNNNDFYANKHAGILVIALNYTGDKLNFGLAIERFRLEFGANKPIHLMFIGEDAALGTRGAGRRGLAGGIILLKVAGAMAESGKSLSEIVSAIESLRGRIATVGVSFGAVALPGSKHFLFDLAPGKMELGLGIHG